MLTPIDLFLSEAFSRIGDHRAFDISALELRARKLHNSATEYPDLVEGSAVK